MAFVFVSILLVCFGELEVILCSSVFCQCLHYCARPVVRQIPRAPWVSGLLAIYACRSTCACSLTMHSVWGVLLSFSVFSSPSSPLIIIIGIIIVQCDRCLGWGWVWQAGLVAGSRVGQAFGVFLLPGLRVGGSSPQVPRPGLQITAGQRTMSGQK